MTNFKETPMWVEDKNGNRCTVKYFGNIENARMALETYVTVRTA